MRRLAVQTGLRIAAFVAFIALIIAGGVGFPPDPGSPEQLRRQDRVERALTGAANAVIARSPEAWDAALPAENEQARRTWREVYDGLACYEWLHLHFQAELVEGDDIYLVDAVGAFDWLTEHLVAERELRVAWTGDEVRLVEDVTPHAYQKGLFLAFTDPLVMQTKHLTIIGESSHRRLMRQIGRMDQDLGLVAAALETEGYVWKSGRTLVTVCNDSWHAADASFVTDMSRATAFAGPAGVYVIAPAFDGRSLTELRKTMRHEFTHVLLPGFGPAPYQCALLLEGVAMKMEGGSVDFSPLQRELETGNRVLPLQRALQIGHLSDEFGRREATLAYLEGSSLVRFIERFWGPDKVEEFGGALSGDEPPDDDDVINAVWQVFGKSWTRFFEEWSRFVRSLP